MAEIKLHNIQKSYDPSKVAFRCESLRIAKGLKVGLAGETGSGKSTMLRMIGGLEKPDQGTIFFGDEDVYPKLDRLIAGHPDIAYLSQSFELPKFISVEEFLYVHPYDYEEVDRIAELCDIVHLLEKDTRALSGGERQRVALAKTLLRKPEVLLLDEPYSNLDPPHKRAMKQIIDELDHEFGMTVLMVSHEPTDLLPWADLVLVLKQGQIHQQGEPSAIYQTPSDGYVAGLFGEYQELESASWNGLNKSEKVYARTEDIQVKIANGKGNGSVIARKYHGGYDLVQIKVGKETITARTAVKAFEAGDSVDVILAKKNPRS